MAGKKGRSGRHLSATVLVHRAYEKVDKALPQLFEMLISRALAGDREAAVYLIDRVMGKPRIEVDQRVSHEVRLTADDYAVLAQAAQLEARELGMTLPQVAQLPAGSAIEAKTQPPE